MLLPHDVVRDAARIARLLADQAMRDGEPDHAAYFDRVAAEADVRADRLLLLQTGLSRKLTAPSAAHRVGDEVDAFVRAPQA